MRILIATYMCRLLNHGDTAMLQVAVNRLCEKWPDARIDVLVRSPERLGLCCPGTTPLLDKGRREWFGTGILPNSAVKLFPTSLARTIRDMDESMRLNFPRSMRPLINLKRWLHPGESNGIDQFWEAVREADLVFAAGGGHVTDAFAVNAELLLKTLQVATRMGRPTVMLGQGFGPVHRADLRELCEKVLPHLDFISLREERASRPFLDAAGVPSDIIMTTGDDAIELAYSQRPQSLGDAVGINMRLAKYSEVPDSSVECVAGVLREMTQKLGRSPQLLPLPISLNDEDSDVETIARILTAAGVESSAAEALDRPEKVIRQAGRCRLAVTGSYHAAVFALSQGVPVIGLAKNGYYVDKFEGLNKQFDGGCEVILLDSENVKSTLSEAIGRMWDQAENMRPRLLKAAERQIALSQAAYDRVFKLMEQRSRQSETMPHK